MSVDEHHVESKADAGASKTFPQQAGNIRKGAYLVIKQMPCKVLDVTTSKPGNHGHAKCHFVAIDIFTGKKLQDIVPSRMVRTDYQFVGISDDGNVSLKLSYYSPTMHTIVVSTGFQTIRQYLYSPQILLPISYG